MSVLLDKTVIVKRKPCQVYNALVNFEAFPLFLKDIVDVKKIEERHISLDYGSPLLV